MDATGGPEPQRSRWRGSKWRDGAEWPPCGGGRGRAEGAGDGGNAEWERCFPSRLPSFHILPAAALSAPLPSPSTASSLLARAINFLAHFPRFFPAPPYVHHPPPPHRGRRRLPAYSHPPYSPLPPEILCPPVQSWARAFTPVTSMTRAPPRARVAVAFGPAAATRFGCFFHCRGVVVFLLKACRAL